MKVTGLRKVSITVIIFFLLSSGLFLTIGYPSPSQVNINHGVSRGTPSIPKACKTETASHIGPSSQINVIDTIKLGPFQNPTGAAFDSSNGYVYVSSRSGTVSVLGCVNYTITPPPPQQPSYSNLYTIIEVVVAAIVLASVSIVLINKRRT